MVEAGVPAAGLREAGRRSERCGQSGDLHGDGRGRDLVQLEAGELDARVPEQKDGATQAEARTTWSRQQQGRDQGRLQW